MKRQMLTISIFYLLLTGAAGYVGAKAMDDGLRAQECGCNVGWTTVR